METSALSVNNVQHAFQIVLQDIHALSEKKLVEDKKIVVNLFQQETISLDTTSNQETSCCGGSSEPPKTPSSTDSPKTEESSFFSRYLLYSRDFFGFTKGITLGGELVGICSVTLLKEGIKLLLS